MGNPDRRRQLPFAPRSQQKIRDTAPGAASARSRAWAARVARESGGANGGGCKGQESGKLTFPLI